jgi:anti-sigma B factor antagonist
MAVHDRVEGPQAAMQGLLRGPSLEIRHVGGNDEVLIELEGELDLASAPRLEHRFRDVIGDAERVVLDVGELTFVDAAGLRPLLQAADHLREHGGALVVVGARRCVRRVIAVLELGDRLGLLETPPEHEA